MKITILSGSTRLNRQSNHVAVALEKRLAVRGHAVEILDLAAYHFPMMEEVLAKHPAPPAGLVEFAEKVRASDAHIFLSPEYNGSYTAALKNAVDYLKESEFSKKAIGVVSVSTGAMGGMRAALNLQELVLGMAAFPIPQMLLVGHVRERFDDEGNLTDASFEPKIASFLTSFLWLAEAVFEKKALD